MTPTTELERLFGESLSRISAPEDPMPYFTAPDLGCPDQGYGDEPKPFAAPKFTPQEQDQIALVKCELERQRRAANERDEDKEIAKLGVVWTDGGDAA